MRSKIKILNVVLFTLETLERKLKEKRSLLNKYIINSQISY